MYDSKKIDVCEVGERTMHNCNEIWKFYFKRCEGLDFDKIWLNEKYEQQWKQRLWGKK